tara:strand:- start:584 stop:769 length:186 start_codon:yes stop_codon:yes gene_type:complete
MEYDSDNIQSIVFIEPKTNNVIIKITGFPNKDLADLYVSWVMNELSFEFTPLNGTIDGNIH